MYLGKKGFIDNFFLKKKEEEVGRKGGREGRRKFSFCRVEVKNDLE